MTTGWASSGAPEREADRAGPVAPPMPSPSGADRAVERAACRGAARRRAPRAARRRRPGRPAGPGRARTAPRAAAARGRRAARAAARATSARLPRGSVHVSAIHAAPSAAKTTASPSEMFAEREEGDRERERRAPRAARRARSPRSRSSARAASPPDRRAASPPPSPSRPRRRSPARAARSANPATRSTGAVAGCVHLGLPRLPAALAGRRRGARSRAAPAAGRFAGSGSRARATVSRSAAGRSGRTDLERRRARLDPARGARGVARPEGMAAGERLPEHDADRPDIGAGGRRLAGEPLGRDVGQGARDVADRGQRVELVHLGEPEVEQAHVDRVALAEQDVRRLDVAVDDAAAVRVRERVQHLCGRLDRLGVVELAGGERLAQGPARARTRRRCRCGSESRASV